MCVFTDRSWGPCRAHGLDSTQTRAPTFTCHYSDTVGFAIGRLAATRAHRIFVVDADHHPIRVISVTDVIRATTSKA